MKQITKAVIGGGLCGWLLASSSLLALEATDAVQRNWPQWRGPLATGVAPHADPPLTWSESENVRWKVAVPGQGSSTPIVWNEQVFILAAVPEPAVDAPQSAASGFGGMTVAEGLPQRFTVLAYDRATGKIRWQHSPRTQVPHEGHHRDHAYASASPITDGEHLIAHFGSFGTYGYDLEGRLIWETDLGDMQTRNSFGEGSSPALHGNIVVILWDHEGPDFLVALDKRTGRELWRQERDEPTGWSTPLIVEHGGRQHVVVNGSNRVRGYDLATGEPLWECGGQTVNAIPTPVPGQGAVYVTSGFRGNALQAIRLGGRGDLTGSEALLWSFNRYTPYVPSPLLYEDLLYLHSGNNAQLSIFGAAQGERHLEAERLDGLRGVYASPVGAAGRVILLGRDGGAAVIRPAPRLEVLAVNRLDDGFDASPALVGREMFLRGKAHLYAIAAP